MKMTEKIKQWFSRSKKHTNMPLPPEAYTREQLEKAYALGYYDGKREGLNLAKYQATQSLKEILRQQNRQ